jgi:hypothetical protein
LRSQSFIIGFWTGSAGVYSIHEVLLAEFDGGGRQELILLESVDNIL